MPTISSTTYVQRRTFSYGSTTNSKEEPSPGLQPVIVINLTNSRVDGGPVPSWKRKIRSGLEATSPLIGTKRELLISEGRFGVVRETGNPTSSWAWSIEEGDLCQSFQPNLLIGFDITPAVNEAKMRFVNRCLKELQALDGQVVLGELGETLRMIRNPMRALRSGIDDYFNALKRRRKGSSNHRRKVLSETWLEYQYGLRPFVSDLEGGLNALSRFSHNPVRFKPVQASAEVSVDHSPPPVKESFGRMEYLINRTYRTVGFVRYWGVVDLQTSGLSVPASTLGFRWDRFVPTLWELLPYSFLADYFSNVGDIISSWAFGTRNLRWVSTLQRTESSYELTVPRFWQNPGATSYTRVLRMIPARSRGTCVSVNRQAAVGSLVPSFRFEVPGMTSLKWLNIAALAHTHRSLTPF
jgi:hypothetical protein